MTPEPISLAAERAAERLMASTFKYLRPDIEALDAARVLLQAYEVTEQEIREQVAGTAHEQPGEGPAYLMAVFESLRVQSVKS